jgi:hypothetical protein
MAAHRRRDSRHPESPAPRRLHFGQSTLSVRSGNSAAKGAKTASASRFPTEGPRVAPRRALQSWRRSLMPTSSSTVSVRRAISQLQRRCCVPPDGGGRPAAHHRPTRRRLLQRPAPALAIGGELSGVGTPHNWAIGRSTGMRVKPAVAKCWSRAKV